MHCLPFLHFQQSAFKECVRTKYRSNDIVVVKQTDRNSYTHNTSKQLLELLHLLNNQNESTLNVPKVSDRPSGVGAVWSKLTFAIPPASFGRITPMVKPLC